MKFAKSIFTSLIVILIVLMAVSYIDYYMVKTKNIVPKIAIKKEYKDKSMILYYSTFYRVWYCTSDKSIVISYYNDTLESSCPEKYSYSNDYYTNALNIKISRKDIELLTDKNVYTKEMIDMLSSESDLNDAVKVANDYGKTFYKIVESKKATVINEEYMYQLVVFPEFVEKGKEYIWQYNTSDETNYYCLKVNNNVESYSKYINGYCELNFNKLKMDTEWCTLYKNTTLIYNEEIDSKFCEE